MRADAFIVSGADDDELVAADAGGDVDATDAAVEELTDLFEHLTAGEVAAARVDFTEAVEVEKDERVRAAETGGTLVLGLERAVEEPQVVEAGEIVADGEVGASGRAPLLL